MKLQLSRNELKEALKLWVKHIGINGTIKDFVISKSTVMVYIPEPQQVEIQIPVGQISTEQSPKLWR